LITQNNKPYIEIRVYGPYEVPAQPAQQDQVTGVYPPTGQTVDESSIYMQNAQGMTRQEECQMRRSFGMDCNSQQAVSDPLVGFWVGKCSFVSGSRFLLSPSGNAPFHLSISKSGDKLQVDPNPADAGLNKQLSYSFDGTRVTATLTTNQGMRGDIRDFKLQGDKLVGTYTDFDNSPNAGYARTVLNCELQKRVVTTEAAQALKKALERAFGA
jgi:hypothetical protein